MEKKEFGYLMARLAIAFKEEISEERIALYYEFLGNSNFDRLKKAIDQIIVENKWFPKISEIDELLYPNKNSEEEWYEYLERETEQFQRLMIEHKENYITKDEAKKLVGDLNQRWKEEDAEQERIRVERFEKRCAQLKKQAKLLS